jgi:hypothetical protein
MMEDVMVKVQVLANVTINGGLPFQIVREMEIPFDPPAKLRVYVEHRPLVAHTADLEWDERQVPGYVLVIPGTLELVEGEPAQAGRNDRDVVEALQDATSEWKRVVHPR